MEKKILFSILLFALHLTCVNANAHGEPVQPKSNTLQCDAPAPDSFRVIGYGQSYATLAWIPVSLGDNHQLTVFKKNLANNWDTLYAVDLYNETTYTLMSLQPTSRYRVEIRTKCSTGEPGTDVSSVNPPQGLIIELTANGRKPIDPKPVDACSYISYVDPVNKWIGFKLTKLNEQGKIISNLFEFEKIEEGDAVARIRRVWNVNDILVAANQQDEWPINKNDLKTTYLLEFNAGEIVETDLDVFGAVEVDVITQPLNVSLCPNPSFPIQAPYEFNVLVASSFELFPTDSPNGPSSGRAVNTKEPGAIRAQSPFFDYLTLFFDETSFLSGVRVITLRDISGKVVFFEKIEVADPIISIPISRTPAGIYFLEVLSAWNSQNIKVIKQ